MARLRSGQLARILARFMGVKFYGKKGRYRILRSDFIKLSGRKTLNDEFVRRIQARLHERGFILIDLGNQFSVLGEGPMEKYRKLVLNTCKNKVVE